MMPSLPWYDDTGLDTETEQRRELSETAAFACFALLLVMLALGLIIERLI